MSDIVERLKDRNKWLGIPTHEVVDMVLEAAAEITRLRDELAKAEARAVEAERLLQARDEQLTAEFAVSSRLAERGRELERQLAAAREALERYSSHDDTCEKIRGLGPACTCGLDAALAGEKP